MHAKLADVMLVLKLESELRLLVLWWISECLSCFSSGSSLQIIDVQRDPDADICHPCPCESSGWSALRVSPLLHDSEVQGW